MTARFQVRPTARERCEPAIRECVAYIAAHEPDTWHYTVMQEASDGTRSLHFFVFANQAALDRHLSSAAAREN